MKQIVHNIFYMPDLPVENSKKDSFQDVLENLQIRNDFFLITKTELGIRKLLKLLPLDAPVLIWVHFGKYHTNKQGYHSNLNIPTKIKNKKILPKSAKINFITRGTVRDIEDAIPFKDTDIKVALEEQIIYGIKIFNPDYLEYIPPYQTPRELLSNNFKFISSQPFYPNQDWNWRIQQLITKVPNHIMAAILGTVIGIDYDNYNIRVIGGGFSGAYVLQVIVKKDQKTSIYLLKISEEATELEQEHKVATSRLFEDLPTNLFTRAYSLSLKEVYGWHCLRYKFETGKNTLRTYLKSNCHKKNSLRLIEKIFDEFTVFEKAGKSLLDSNIHPYNKVVETDERGQQEVKYEGLILKKEQRFRVLSVIEKIENRFLKESTSDFKIKSRLHHFKRFLLNERGFYKDKSIQELSTPPCTPLSIPHGDFHTANILYDNQTDTFSFIDFANVPTAPVKHKFLDIGKFSADMEISIFSDKDLLQKKNLLTTWMNTHQQWLYQQPFEKIPKHVKDIYQHNSLLRDTILPTKTPNGMPSSEAVRQFQMVRLHYFLKAISYDHEIREKILFFIRASIDILEFLIPSQNEHH